MIAEYWKPSQGPDIAKQNFIYRRWRNSLWINMTEMYPWDLIVLNELTVLYLGLIDN